jgi:hypothetical protein
MGGRASRTTKSRGGGRTARPGLGRSRGKRQLVALSVLLLGACSFSSEPLLAGQRIGEDESPADRDDRTGGDRTTDSGTATAPTPNAGAGGSAGASGSAGANAAQDAAMTDAGSAPSPDAGGAVADAKVEDSAPPPPDPQPDAAIEPDTGTPRDCPCVCPHELQAVLNDPSRAGCTLVACPTAECAPDSSCTLSSLGTRGYYVCDELHNWEDAKDHCDELEDVYLASVDSAEEDQLLLSSLDDKTWIGGNDLEEEGDFRWQNGDLFWSGGAPSWDGNPQGPGPGGPGPGGGGDDEGGAPVNGAYTNFIGYEPNDEGLDGSKGDCVILWPDVDQWADADCDDVHGYVCEFALPPLPVIP